MLVIIFYHFNYFGCLSWFFLSPGRDHDYQTLILTYATNVFPSSGMIRMFPEPLKPCIVPSIHITLLLKSTLVLFYAWYQKFRPWFDRRLNLSDLWLRSDLRRWRNTETTGMINRFVRPCICYFSHYTTDSQNDLLMWLMSEAKGVERSVEGLARRLLIMNFASIHLTSLASVDVLFPPYYTSLTTACQ